jgi:hypothetical protein
VSEKVDNEDSDIEEDEVPASPKPSQSSHLPHGDYQTAYRNKAVTPVTDNGNGYTTATAEQWKWDMVNNVIQNATVPGSASK